VSTLSVIFSFEPRPQAYVCGRAETAHHAGLLAALSPEEGRRIFGIDAVPDTRAPLSDFLGPVADGLLRSWQSTRPTKAAAPCSTRSSPPGAASPTSACAPTSPSSSQRSPPSPPARPGCSTVGWE
jgi:hypothetical protein